MRTARVLTIALLTSAAATLSAGADPITNPSAVDQQTGASSFDALFDGGGSPFILTFGPAYFQLPPRGGSNTNDGDNGGTGAGGNGGGNPFAGDFLPAFFSGGGPGGDNGPGGSGFPGNSENAFNSSNSENSGGAGDALGALAGLGDLPGNSFVPQNGSYDDTSTEQEPDPGVPEPSTILLLAPAAALLLRRRARTM
jgi:hypothetical protein